MKKIGIIISSLLLSTTLSAQDHKHHEMPTSPSAAKISDKSVYNFEGKFTDQNSKSAILKDLSNKRVLITMAYTSCQFSCPIIIGKLKEIEKNLIKRKINDVQIVLVSFDLKRDTADKFQSYIKTKNITDKNWHFLRASSPEDIQEIAALLGVNYKAEPDGEFSHSNVISLLDKKGVIVHQLVGMQSDTSDLFDKIKGIK